MLYFLYRHIWAGSRQETLKQRHGGKSLLKSFLLGLSEGVMLNDPVDPVEVVSDLGVDTRIISVCTADAPGHNALKLVVTDKWTPGIALKERRSHG